MRKIYLLLSLCLTLPLASAPDAPATRPKHRSNTKHRPRHRTKTQRTSTQKHHARTKQAPKAKPLSKKSRTQHQDHTTTDEHNPYAWPTLIIGGTLITIALITHQTSRRNRIIPPKPIKPVKPNNLNNNPKPKPIKPIQPVIPPKPNNLNNNTPPPPNNNPKPNPIKPIPNDPPKNNNDNKPKKTVINNGVMVTDTDGRITLVKANPFELPTGFKTFDINWEKSTLDQEKTLASVEQHQNRLQLINIDDNAKYIWPFFITFRLLKNIIMFNQKWANIFFQHCTDSFYKDQVPMEFLSATFLDDYYEGKPRFFHRTGFKNIQVILKSGHVKVSKNPKPGAFVSQGGTAEKSSYGNIILCFRDLDFYDLPISYWWGSRMLYLGFWNEVDLKKLLTHVYVEDIHKSKIPQIEQYLQQYGYKDIKVSTIPQKDIKHEYKDIDGDNDGLYSFGPKIVPSFYPIQGMRGGTRFLNRENEEIVCNRRHSRDNEQELYKNKPITFFRGGRNITTV